VTDPTDAERPRGISPTNAYRDALVAYAIVAVLVTGFVQINITLGAFGHVGSGLVALLFLYVPVLYAKRRNEDLDDYGFHWDPVKKSLIYCVAGMFVFYPIFSLLFFAFYEVACNSELLANLVPRGMCARYGGLSGLEAPALDLELAKFAAIQLVAVALPEELFFRGFVLGLLEKRFPPKYRVLGGGIGKALLLSSLMFALIHIPKDGDPRVLATLVPGLFFGWLRSATGSILAPTIAHGGANVLIRVLETSTMR
jgi:membrane protease YdiL (CAAX protease family)